MNDSSHESATPPRASGRRSRSGTRRSQPNRPDAPATGPTTVRLATMLVVAGACACGEAPPPAEPALAIMSGTSDYCAIPEVGLDVLADLPSASAPPIDDVNWFARPVPHDGDEWIIAFASHDENFLYDLTNDRRVRIPDRSDAVATPDGRYMTVPSFYTSDSNIRFYPVAPMLAALDEGRDVPDLEPAFIHDHEAMHRVYYQSTALVSERTDGDRSTTTYRLMFSGTSDESRFRIVDYAFHHDATSGALIEVEPSAPMAICPSVQNDLNTPFISKDGRYVAAYTAEAAANAHVPGASLKVFRIDATDPGAGTTACTRVADLGFAAGKADFSFDGSMLAFHSSQGAYLTPFVNGGLPSGTITDVMVARFEQDMSGAIVGHTGVQRLSTSLESGVGSYFPAFFPDDKLFFLANNAPRDAETGKQFRFRVVDPVARGWRTATFASADVAALWTRLGSLWQEACTPTLEALGAEPFPLDEHELPLQAMSLNVPQCQALVRDARTGVDGSEEDWDALAGLCTAIER